MSVIALVVVLLFLAFVLWLVSTKGGALHPAIKMLINIVVIGTAIILVLWAFGIWDEVRSVKVPHI